MLCCYLFISNCEKVWFDSRTIRFKRPILNLIVSMLLWPVSSSLRRLIDASEKRCWCPFSPGTAMHVVELSILVAKGTCNWPLNGIQSNLASFCFSQPLLFLMYGSLIHPLSLHGYMNWINEMKWNSYEVLLWRTPSPCGELFSKKQNVALNISQIFRAHSLLELHIEY